MTVAAAIADRIVYSRAFGAADLENAVPATTETLIRTGSISKPISAAAAMTLVDAGMLDLDAPGSFDVALALDRDALFFDDIGPSAADHRIRRAAFSWSR